LAFNGSIRARYDRNKISANGIDGNQRYACLRCRHSPCALDLDLSSTHRGENFIAKRVFSDRTHKGGFSPAAGSSCRLIRALPSRATSEIFG